MKGNTLTFHDKKSLAAISDTIGQAAMNAAFFMVYGVFWLILLPFEWGLKLNDKLDDLMRKYNL
jgi:hypothetical protein